MQAPDGQPEGRDERLSSCRPAAGTWQAHCCRVQPEYILQKTPIKPEAPARLGKAPVLPCRRSSACPAWQRLQRCHQVHIHVMAAGTTALHQLQLQSRVACREALLTLMHSQ